MLCKTIKLHYVGMILLVSAYVFYILKKNVTTFVHFL